MTTESLPSSRARPSRPTPSRRLAVVAAVNKPAVLRRDLARSPMLAQGRVPLTTREGYACASEAYNAGLDEIGTSADVVIFAHQDVYFPADWDHWLGRAMNQLDASDPAWGVLGVFGTSPEGGRIGRVWSSGIGAEIGEKLDTPAPAVTLDELVIVIRTDRGLRFDDKLPCYHLYATDIVQTARLAGYSTHVFDGPVIHNSEPVRSLDATYGQAYRYMQRKWRDHLPLITPIVPITRWGWPLCQRRVKRWVGVGRCTRPKGTGLDDPRVLACGLGYE